jgi:hypothetical protein
MIPSTIGGSLSAGFFRWEVILKNVFSPERTRFFARVLAINGTHVAHHVA